MVLIISKGCCKLGLTIKPCLTKDEGNIILQLWFLRTTLIHKKTPRRLTYKYRTRIVYQEWMRWCNIREIAAIEVTTFKKLHFYKANKCHIPPAIKYCYEWHSRMNMQDGIFLWSLKNLAYISSFNINLNLLNENQLPQDFIAYTSHSLLLMKNHISIIKGYKIEKAFSK